MAITLGGQRWNEVSMYDDDYISDENAELTALDDDYVREEYREEYD